jgi:hypothetical protein
MNFVKLNFDLLRSSRQISATHVKFFKDLLNMQEHYFIYNGKTFLQLLIQENKNIQYIIMLLKDLLKTPPYHRMIYHPDSDGLTPFIQMIIQRPNQLIYVIKIFMSFPCFNKNITYNGKTAEDYIKESLLNKTNKEILLNILNPNLKRTRTEMSCEDEDLIIECLLKLSKIN